MTYIPGGGGPAAPVELTAVTVAVGYGVPIGEATVIDPDVSPSSDILIGWANHNPAAENCPDMDSISFQAIAGSGQFTVRIVPINAVSAVGGSYNLLYLVG